MGPARFHCATLLSLVDRDYLRNVFVNLVSKDLMNSRSFVPLSNSITLVLRYKIISIS